MSYTGHQPDPVKKIVSYKGLPIAIEWFKGEVRQYSDGYRKLMQCHYGFVPGVESSYDGDEIDIFLGEENSDMVYAFIQRKFDLSGIDELKFMVGFSDQKSASLMFAAHVSTSMYGGLAFTMTLQQFKELINLITGAQHDSN